MSNIELGKVYNEPYALSRVHISTGAGQEPTVSADGVQIEDDASQTVCTYVMDTVSVTPARHALTFDAFTYVESASLVLQTSEFEAACTIDPTTVNNDPVASDAIGGVETVSVTFWSSSDSTQPTVTAKSGWHITSDWTCTGSDASMFVWTATFSKYLSVKAVTGGV